MSAPAAKPTEPEKDARRAPLFGSMAMISLAVLLTLVALCWIFASRTEDAMGSFPFLHHKRSPAAARPSQTLVDQTPWQTALTLAGMAKTQEELVYARQAERLADHAVDQAFATALREATLAQRTLNPQALAIQSKVRMLEGMVASDTASVKALTPKGGEDLELAKAQLDLDQDQLTEAGEDLAEASGDQRGAIQQELTAREAELKSYDATAGNHETAVTAAQQYTTLAALIGAWGRQNDRLALVLEAKDDAQRTAASLAAERQRVAAQAGAAPAASSPDRLAELKRVTLQRELVSLYGGRISSEQQLAGVYEKWAAQIRLEHRILKHLILLQAMEIAIILIVAILLGAMVSRLAERESLDRRRLRTLGRIARLVVQIMALIAVLLVVFGPPQHTSTIIGLTTAGLTVALQDFILAFVGWFILMGRSGVAVGDFVEINGVTGEVVEIGLFRTTMLETGNWTAKGHPTGRRVAFNNKFAISGQYFNFSTTGQWMWDELAVPVPAGQDSRAAAERVYKAVAEETGPDAAQAEQEWRQASQRHGLSQFSAEPAVNLRPSGASVDLVVRYVTRASDRFDRRNKIYQRVIEAVREADTSAPGSPAAPTPAPTASA
jgi:small-conductance mechanosensitive channel